MVRLIMCDKDHHERHKDVEDSEITNAHIYKLLERIYHKQQEESFDSYFAPEIRGIMEDAIKVMRNPPSTWQPYLKTRNIGAIAHMEFGELLKAFEEHKSFNAIRKEVVHSLAAMFMYAE